MGTLQIRGTADICVDLCSKYRYYCWGNVIIDANVTDSTSNTTVQCKGQTSVPVSYRPYKLKILEEDRAFTPCHFTTVKVHYRVHKTVLEHLCRYMRQL